MVYQVGNDKFAEILQLQYSAVGATVIYILFLILTAVSMSDRGREFIVLAGQCIYKIDIIGNTVRIALGDLIFSPAMILAAYRGVVDVAHGDYTQAAVEFVGGIGLLYLISNVIDIHLRYAKKQKEDKKKDGGK